ncbi:MAG: sulfite exporter TauE/SafE family protein [Desulfovibrionaceae bacterium]|nr:sulfite exporter TauE/SafE family protein [Desulfovibrionaceae bacterium]
MHFPVAGVDASPFLPPLAAFAVSLLTGLGGVSGAFLLLPFQVSVLGCVNPSASSTNQVFNIIAAPGAVWRYYREGRLYAPLARLIVLGSLPGTVLGAFIRLRWLADPVHFKSFAALVLLFLALRMGGEALRPKPGEKAPGDARPAPLPDRDGHARFLFQDREYAYAPLPLLGLSLIIGVVGGIYGVGGGALLAPILVSVYGLPVHVTAGPTLLGTLAASAGGVLAYMLMAPLYPRLGASPDWSLGLLLGAGGLAGMYLAARLQRHLPARPIRILLTLVVLGTAVAWLAPGLKQIPFVPVF